MQKTNKQAMTSPTTTKKCVNWTSVADNRCYLPLVELNYFMLPDHAITHLIDYFNGFS